MKERQPEQRRRGKQILIQEVEEEDDNDKTRAKETGEDTSIINIRISLMNTRHWPVTAYQFLNLFRNLFLIVLMKVMVS